MPEGLTSKGEFQRNEDVQDVTPETSQGTECHSLPLAQGFPIKEVPMDVVELTLDHSEASKEPEDLAKEARHQASVWRYQERFSGSTS